MSDSIEASCWAIKLVKSNMGEWLLTFEFKVLVSVELGVDKLSLLNLVDSDWVQSDSKVIFVTFGGSYIHP